MKTLRLVLGDQLNAAHSWYQKKSENNIYLIAELPQEVNYVTHHVQKVCAFFLAMENFAKALQQAGHSVIYLTLDETQYYSDLTALLDDQLLQGKIEKFEYQLPDEYRLREQLKIYCAQLKIPSAAYTAEHFIVAEDELPNYFQQDKAHRMENFYRKMRVKTQTLMQDDKPLGEQWNYDSLNRKKFKKSDLANIPAPLLFTNNASAVLQRLEQHNIKIIGKAEEQLLWPVNRKQARELLAYFCEHLLPWFGTFQDAMTANSDFQWSLYHSRLSFALNAKIIHPLEVVDTAVAAFEKNDDIDLAQIEGFVRQIIGWREFIRGIYWANMPTYASENALMAERKLPAYFWNGETNMQCMHQAITQSLEYAYAHHIQRLMVTGNFCLLTGINPDEVDAWYLGIYIDAIEWVEMPNTRGMTQFAVGGLVASKPYAASGNYTNKMSDYCSSCYYKVKEKTADNSCPFNSLYWGFMLKHRALIEKNPRIGMIYRNWDKRDTEEKQAVLARAQWCLDNIETL